MAIFDDKNIFLVIFDLKKTQKHSNLFKNNFFTQN